MGSAGGGRRLEIPLDARDVGLLGDGAAPAQRPYAALLGCADARVPTELIFGEGPNDLFVVRVAGNVLGQEVLGSLRYAADHLPLRAAVVLGHSGCGAVAAAVDLFQRPAGLLALATDHALRGLLDRLMAETIKFRPIPPRSPHLNGKVERAQRTVVEEFWPTVEARAPDVGDQLAVWVHYYNWDRPHEGPGGLCPIDRVCERLDKTPIWAEVDDAYDTARERIQVREYAVETALRRLK